jgi:DNA-binding transcriptional MocR family regulator
MANPLYRQIAEDLREQIASGELQPGQQLRTEIELRDHYGASRNTDGLTLPSRYTHLARPDATKHSVC